MYTPNFDNPKVIKRSKTALGFCLGVFSQTKPKEWSTRHIDQYFGQKQNNLSQYLRTQLLCIDDNHYNMDTGKCKKYTLNYEGAKQLHKKLFPNIDFTLKRKYDLVTQSAATKHHAEFETGNFKYNDKSNRYWHPLQNHNSEERKQMFAQYGYCHIYDIKACAPTLITHLAESLAPKQTITIKRMSKTFDYLLCNMNEIRSELAHDIGIDVTDAKRIINSLFAGAKLACNPDTAIFKLLNCDYDKMHLLQQHPRLCELRSAITTAWSIIARGEISGEPVILKRTNQRINSKHKWAVYFKYERAIMSIVIEYLNARSIKYFIEHDGWSCNQQLNLIELENIIRKKTDINRLKLDYNFCSTSTDVLVEKESSTDVLRLF